jgi:membrane-associated phospholipid phosphatase
MLRSNGLTLRKNELARMRRTLLELRTHAVGKRPHALLAPVHALTSFTRRTGLPWIVALLSWVLVVSSWAHSAPAPASRFRLLHDVEEILTWTWGGARTAFTLPTLTYLLPAAAIVGGASVADDAVQAHFQGQDEDDALARAGKIYAMLYFGPVQAALYTAGELTHDTQLSTTSKKAFASLLGAQSLIHPLKYLTQRRRPDGSNRLAFPSADVGAASSLIPAVYTGYGLVPATVAAASAAFIGLTRIAGNKHHLSDVLAGYAIGLGWGLLVETYHRRRAPWALLPMSDGYTMVGLALHLRWD